MSLFDLETYTPGEGNPLKQLLRLAGRAKGGGVRAGGGGVSLFLKIEGRGGGL